MTTAGSSWRDTGNTDLSSFIKSLSRSVSSGSSPMSVHASAIHGLLYPYGLTRLAAAMSWHETKNFSWTCALHPQPCIPSQCLNPWAMTGAGDAGSIGRWAKYSTYQTAARSWSERLLNASGPYANTTSVSDLVAVYAPSFENDVDRYVNTICREIDALPFVSEGDKKVNPFPVPSAIFDIKRDDDAMLFSLTPDERNRLLSKCIPHRSGLRPRVIVLHIQDGVTAGSLDWWANNVQASSTVLINKSGSIVRCIPPEHGPWTNGDAIAPTATGQRVISSYGPSPNAYSLTIEAEGRPADAMPQAQLDSICWQVFEWQQQYGIDISDVIKHSDLNSSTGPNGRANCPGPYYDRVVSSLQRSNSALWPNKPSWMPDDLIKELFPEATPNGPRTISWFEYISATGHAPRRVKWHFKGSDREVIEFSNGLLIFKDGSRSSDK